MIANLDCNGFITEKDKAKALRLMPVPTLSRDVIQEYAMSTMEHSGAQLVIRKRMMQEWALLPEFVVKEYFSNIFGKGQEEVMELSLMMWLLLVPMIALDKNLVTATTNKALMSAAG